MNGDEYAATGTGIMGYNMFTYCNDNPVMLADYSGNSPCPATHAHIRSSNAGTLSEDEAENCTGHNAKDSLTALRNELFAFAAIVYAESGGENQKTQKAVAHSINNRIELNHWTNPDSIIDAISYPWQYEAYNNSRYKAALEYYTTGSISNTNLNNSQEISSMNSCLEAVIPIYFGKERDFTNGVMYFHSFANPSDWPYHDDYEQVFIPDTKGFWWYR